MSSCNRCDSWAESPAETLKFLKGEREACPSCPHKATIEKVTRQFKSNCSQWWVVNGVAVVPVWIKEQLHVGRMRFG